MPFFGPALRSLERYVRDRTMAEWGTDSLSVAVLGLESMPQLGVRPWLYWSP